MKRTVRQERSIPQSLCWPDCCGWSAAGLGWRPFVVLSPCGGWPKDQEEGGGLLPSECQGSRSAEMRRVVRWGCREAKAAWAGGCPELDRLVRWGCRRWIRPGQSVVRSSAERSGGTPGGCSELRSNVFTPAGDGTVVQRWSVVCRTLRRIPVGSVMHEYKSVLCRTSGFGNYVAFPSGSPNGYSRAVE